MSENEMEQGAAIVALVRDLMFASRIRGAAPEAVVVRTPEALGEAVGPGTRLVLVDLQAAGAVEAVASVRGRTDARLVAWAPHVMEAELAAAREAGADDVMARGTFVKALPRLTTNS